MPELNDASIKLITEFEGFVPNWYPDPAHGWKVPTCCYGHTDAAGEPKYAATKDKTFTKEEGMTILRRDLRRYSNAVDRLVKVPLNANQYGALTSFTYNLGEGNFGSSTLLKKLNAGDYVGAANEFKRWNKAGGKVLAGLTRRRAAEAALFSTPASGPIPVSGIGGSPSSVEVTKPAPGAGPAAAVVGLVAALGAGVYIWLKSIGVPLP